MNSIHADNVAAATATAAPHSPQQQQQQQHQQFQQQQLNSPTHHIILLPPNSSSSVVELGIANNGPEDSSAKIMEWTNDDALELIEQYRCHTELWNRADPKYKDKLCRFRAWSEIADRFGCSKAEVERKMNVLLTQYRREKHKMFVKIYQGIQPNPSKWYAFKRFDFMEAGGGSLSGLPTSGLSVGVQPSSSSTSSASHNGLNGLASAAVAAAAYENSTIAAAANGGATGGAGGGPGVGLGGGGGGTLTMPGSHRRIKTKELKYFGAMGLNIPMLIASGQTLDNWNTTGQYSPPIGNPGGGEQQQQQQLRVPMPMSYGGVGGAGALPYTGGGGGGGGGGGSSSSEFLPSPHKTIDTSDNEDNPHRDEATAAALGQLAAKVERRSPLYSNAGIAGGGGGGDTRTPQHDDIDPTNGPTVPGAGAGGGSVTLSESGSSPIPNTNTNMHEAHKNHLLQSSPVSHTARAVTPRQAHEQLHHHHHLSHQALQHHHAVHHVQQHELDIKQELVDYFHAPPPGGGGAGAGGVGAAAGAGGDLPPPAPESHRSYGSAGDPESAVGSQLQLDMAQDLRVAAQAKVGGFALPPRSSSAHHLAAAAAAATLMPLNMRKSAGHLLMNTLLSSRESMSDPDADADVENDDEATDMIASSPGHIKSSVSACQDANSAAAAAAALYAESLQRDDCDFIGSNVSMKLRTMDRTQRIIAEKLIGEVLFFGQFNELERTARIQPK